MWTLQLARLTITCQTFTTAWGRPNPGHHRRALEGGRGKWLCELVRTNVNECVLPASASRPGQQPSWQPRAAPQARIWSGYCPWPTLWYAWAAQTVLPHHCRRRKDLSSPAGPRPPPALPLHNSRYAHRNYPNDDPISQKQWRPYISILVPNPLTFVDPRTPPLLHQAGSPPLHDACSAAAMACARRSRNGSSSHNRPERGAGDGCTTTTNSSTNSNSNTQIINVVRTGRSPRFKLLREEVIHCRKKTPQKSKSSSSRYRDTRAKQKRRSEEGVVLS